MKKEEFEYMVNRCYTMYMQQNNDVLFNLLDSHDTERLMNRFHDLDKFYQQLAILFHSSGKSLPFIMERRSQWKVPMIRTAEDVCHERDNSEENQER